MIGRYLSGKFKDKKFEEYLKRTHQKDIEHDDIDEEKEREGMYPNELDEEMSNYTWGEKIYPGWSHSYYGWGAGNYSSPGWGNYWTNQKDFAPSYNPYSHFEAPYYHYPMKYDGRYVWNNNFRNYWGNV